MSVAREPQFALGSTHITFHPGNIIDWVGQMPVVSSDGNYLSHSGGVSRAIWQAVGEDNIKSDPAVIELPTMPSRPTVGEVIETGGSDGIPRVIHGVTMDLDLDENLDAQSANLLYTNVFESVDLSSESEVATPLLGTGLAGMSELASMRALLLAANERGVLPFPLLVHVVCYGSPSVDGCLDSALTEAHQLRLVTNTDPLRAQARRASTRDLPGGIRSAVDMLDQAADYEQATQAGLTLWVALENSDSGAEYLTGEQGRRIRKAREARNRLVHGRGRNSALVRDLLRGCDARLAALWATSQAQTRAEVTHRSRPESGHGWAELAVPLEAEGPFPDSSHRRNDFSPESAEVRGVQDSRTRPRRWSPNGTDHVRALRDLILDNLDEESLAREHERLAQLGLQGGRDECLLESCVDDDPMAVLQRHFSGAQLQRILSQSGLPSRPTANYDLSAQTLLEHLGFPPAVSLVNPQSVRQQVLVFQSEISTSDATAIFGHVAQLAKDLERILQIYVRFLAEGILQTAPDAWLAEAQERGKCKDVPPLYTKATIGQLVLGILKQLGEDIDRSSDLRVKMLAAEVKGPKKRGGWLPPEAYEFPSQRNRWIHGSEVESHDPTLGELRSEAKTFCELAHGILTFLIEGPLPETVLIEEVNLDRWGRKRVQARSGTGFTEMLFTDVQVVPGQAYLMHTRTNPLRVDPVLVAMGLSHTQERSEPAAGSA